MNKREIKQFLREQYGIEADTIEKLKGGVINDNYRANGSHGDFVFKVYTMRTPEEVQFEVEVLERLAKKNFPAPRLVWLNGTTQAAASFHGKPAVVYCHIAGKPMKNTSTRALVSIGNRLGDMHAHLRSYLPRVKKDTRLAPEPEDLRQYITEYGPSIEKSDFPDAKEFVAFVAGEFEKLSFPKNIPYGIVHNDVKPANVICHRRGAHFIDFDNINRGALIYDVMTLAIWACFDGPDLNKKKFRQLLKGYEMARPLTRVERAHLPDAILFRLLREAFVWPMRINSPESRRIAKLFLARYNKLDHANLKSLWKK